MGPEFGRALSVKNDERPSEGGSRGRKIILVKLPVEYGHMCDLSLHYVKQSTPDPAELRQATES